MLTISQAVVLCAGYGKRMLPFTKFYPKSALAVGDRFAICIVLDEVVKSGVNEVILVVNKKDKIIIDIVKAYARQNQIKVVFVKQKKMRGAGGALLLCKKYIRDVFFLVFADDLTKSSLPVCLQLAKVFKKTQKNIMAVRKVVGEEAKKYGVLNVEDRRGNLIYFSKITEKPNHVENENFVNFGRYVLTKDIFQNLKNPILEMNGEIYLTKIFQEMAGCKKMLAVCFKGSAFDIGSMENYKKTFQRLKNH